MTVLALTLSWFLFLVCLAMGVGAWMVFMWSVRSGQFEDTEETAQHMLDADRQGWEEPPSPEDGDAEPGTAQGVREERTRVS